MNIGFNSPFRRRQTLRAVSLFILLAGLFWAAREEETHSFSWPTAEALSTSRYIDASAFQSSATSEQPNTALRCTTVAGYRSIDFNRLSQVQAEGKNGQLQALLPGHVMELDQAKVGIAGFAFPLFQERGGTVRVLLFRDRETMFEGLEPQVSRWVFVTLDKPSLLSLDGPVSCYGTLKVGPSLVQGQLQTLYRLESAFMSPL